MGRVVLMVVLRVLLMVLLPEWREGGVLPVVGLRRRGRDSRGSHAFLIVDFYLIDGKAKIREAASNPEEFFVAPGAAEELRPLCRPFFKQLP